MLISTFCLSAHFPRHSYTPSSYILPFCLCFCFLLSRLSLLCPISPRWLSKRLQIAVISRDERRGSIMRQSPQLKDAVRRQQSEKIRVSDVRRDVTGALCTLCGWLALLSDVLLSDYVPSGGRTAWAWRRWSDVSLKTSDLIFLIDTPDGGTHCLHLFIYFRSDGRSILKWLTSSEKKMSFSPFVWSL